MSIEAARETEIAKYRKLYADYPAYCMSPARLNELKRDWVFDMTEATWLDVGCGRGETERVAKQKGATWRGIDAVLGDEPLPDIVAPDDSWELVTCLDVMEHLPAADWRETVESIGRVASKRILFAISNEEDSWGKEIGAVLHITRLPYDHIDSLLSNWLPKWKCSGWEEGDGCEWWEFVAP